MVHGIIELVAQDLRGSHDNRGVGVLFSIPCEDAADFCSKGFAELLVNGVGKSLERGGIPGSEPPQEVVGDGLHGDPGLSGARQLH